MYCLPSVSCYTKNLRQSLCHISIEFAKNINQENFGCPLKYFL